MDAKEWKELMRRRVNALNENREREMLVICLDLIALIKFRIQDKGLSYEETPFHPYSPGYKAQRAKAGFQTDYVDFTRTGRLWANVKPYTVDKTELTTTIKVTAPEPDNQLKLRGALTRPRVRPRGNILLPSDQEIEWLLKANKARIDKYLKL